MSNNTNNLTLDCPVYTNSSAFLIEQVQFWVEGVIQTCVAIPGLMGKFMPPSNYWKVRAPWITHVCSFKTDTKDS